jgi:Mg2+ and Co2+ transporter CorA
MEELMKKYYKRLKKTEKIEKILKNMYAIEDVLLKDETVNRTNHIQFNHILRRIGSIRKCLNMGKLP